MRRIFNIVTSERIEMIDKKTCENCDRICSEKQTQKCSAYNMRYWIMKAPNGLQACTAVGPKEPMCRQLIDTIIGSLEYVKLWPDIGDEANKTLDESIEGIEKLALLNAEMLAALEEYVNYSCEHDIGSGDVVVATCESREKAIKAIAKAKGEKQ